MTYTYWRIDRTPYIGNLWDTTQTTTLTDVSDPKLSVNMGDAKDDFTFLLGNPHGTYDNYFNVQDKIVIYRKTASTALTSTDIIMVGAIKDIPVDNTGQKESLKIQGYNFSEAIAGAIIFYDPNGGTIPQALQGALGEANRINSNFQVVWNTATNPTVRIDGSAFPSVYEQFFYKPLRQLVETYSTRQATGDVGYNWYINESNQFIWVPNTSGIDYTFNSDTSLYTSIKIRKDIKDIKNYFILKGGRDPAGKPIMKPYMDWESISRHGMKFQYVPSIAQGAEVLNKQDLNASYGAANVNKQNTTYPTFPFTSTWKSLVTTSLVDGAYTINMVTGSYVTFNTGDTTSNQKLYTLAIRKQTEAQLLIEGRNWASALKFGKLKIDVEFPAGSSGWKLGDNIICTIPVINATDKTLKVKEIQYSYTYDTYSIEESVGTL